MPETILITASEMKAAFLAILFQQNLAKQKAETLADVFTANSVDGVYTHGVNRFPVFVNYVKEGIVDKDAEPVLMSAFNGMEQWNGNLGPGPLNAIIATDRAVDLAKQYGIGCVALGGTNHWMRGGYYGWHAAKRGCFFIGWTNTIGLMPAWGATDSKLGNNPLVMALPYGDEAIVLDAAMSQYSFGAMDLTAAKGEKLPVMSGYDKEGKMTDDPAAIMKSKRPLPIGYWKGAGLSLLLDILAAVLSGGLSVHEISSQGKERGLSQIFICIDPSRLSNASMIAKTVAAIIDDYHHSTTEGAAVRYPGERVVQIRKENLRSGIPVLKKVWDEIQLLLSS